MTQSHHGKREVAEATMCLPQGEGLIRVGKSEAQGWPCWSYGALEKDSGLPILTHRLPGPVLESGDTVSSKAQKQVSRPFWWPWPWPWPLTAVMTVEDMYTECCVAGSFLGVTHLVLKTTL